MICKTSSKFKTFINIVRRHYSEDTVKKTKNKVMDWEKIFIKCVSAKDFYKNI